MANIKSIVDECLTISEAFTSIKSQTYNEIGAVNFEDNDKDYPMFLFDKKSIGISITDYGRNKLPSEVKYTADLYFYNTYTEEEKISTSLQTKQEELIIIAEQFIAELKNRTDSTNNSFFVNTVDSSSVTDEINNDRLIEVKYSLEFISRITSCDTGQFEYNGLDKPNNLTATAQNETEINLSWIDNATNETNYEIYRSLDCDNFSLIDTISANSTSYNDVGLSSNTVYFYKIRAISATSNGAFSIVVYDKTDSGGACADSNVENSDQSYTDTVISGGTLVLPDITVTDINGSTYTHPAVVDVSCTLGVVPSGIAYLRDYNSMQTTSYALYDDGWQFANGGYNFTHPTNPATVQKLDLTTDNTGRTLMYDNAFGNKLRFTDASGNGVSSVNGQYVVDNLTGLGWWDFNSGGVTWGSIFGASGLLKADNDANFQGYNDWFVANYKQYDTLVNYEYSASTNSSFLLPYTNTLKTFYWSSTTRPSISTNAIYFDYRGWSFAALKTTLYRYLYCRKHF